MKHNRRTAAWIFAAVILALAGLAAGLITARPAAAGGWATVTIDEMPAEIAAGAPFTIRFTVRQHGQTPLAGLMLAQPDLGTSMVFVFTFFVMAWLAPVPRVVIRNTLIAFFIGALTMTSVGRAAGKMVDEIRRQFREIPGLLEGKPGVKPEPEKCVDISARAALRDGDTLSRSGSDEFVALVEATAGEAAGTPPEHLAHAVVLA